MVKEFLYHNVKAIMEVSLDFMVKKRMDGRVVHKITLTCDSTSYNKEKQCLDGDLKDTIEGMESEWKNSICKKSLKSKNELLLSSLGFVKKNCKN